MYREINIMEELCKLSKGKKTKVPASEIAFLALEFLPAEPKPKPKRDRALEELQAIYSLIDPRSAI